MKDRPSIPRTILGVLLPIVIMFVISMAVYIVALALYPSIGASYATADEFMLANDGYISCIALFISVIVFYLMFRKDLHPKSREIIEKPIYFLPLVIVGCLASQGLSILISLLNIDNIIGSYENASTALFSGGPIIVIIRVVFLSAIVEELVFRGLVFNKLRLCIGFWPSALIASALFGVYHLNLAQGLYAFIFGLFLCVIYERFYNILAPIVVHAAANAFSVVIEYTGLEYPSVTVYVIVMILSLGVSCAIYFLFLREKKTN